MVPYTDFILNLKKKFKSFRELEDVRLMTSKTNFEVENTNLTIKVQKLSEDLKKS